MSNDIDKSVNRLNAAETIRRQATIQASKALKQAHLMQDTADMLDQADQRDEENKISRMLMHKIAQQGE